MSAIVHFKARLLLRSFAARRLRRPSPAGPSPRDFSEWLWTVQVWLQPLPL